MRLSPGSSLLCPGSAPVPSSSSADGTPSGKKTAPVGWNQPRRCRRCTRRWGRPGHPRGRGCCTCPWARGTGGAAGPWCTPPCSCDG
uniref:Putative secreted protein n=1 Tax=Ixodes ricinus TaxID=34613 RepID=A0A6B0U9V8_IXORI